MQRKPFRPGRFGLIGIILAVILVLVLLYQGGRWLETRSANPESRSDHTLRYDYEPTIEVDGARYRRRKDLTTILLMGIDRTSNAVSLGYQNGGQADFLRLLVLDHDRDTITQLAIDRDTMTPIAIIGVLGNRSSTRVAQICLSHGFGDGREQSCELTVEAVSNLLLGTPIDFYMALDMDGISILNDWAGGVTVTLEDDFTHLDPTMQKGSTLTLMGDQAEYFVRNRMQIGEGTNAARMKRQQQYISQLLHQLEQKIGSSEEAMGQLLDALNDQLLTNMARGRLINEVWGARDYSRLPLTELAGAHQIGTDGFMEFETDAQQLQETVLTLFYEKVK